MVRSEARIRRVGAYVAAIVAGGFVGLTVTLLMIRQFGPGALPEVTRGTFDLARQQWRNSAIRDYDMEIVVNGQERSVYRIQIREGVVVAACRNNEPLTHQRTLHTWSIEGLFETIERDLTAVELRQRGERTAGTPDLRLRGRFDRQYGVPLRYQRVEIRRFEQNRETSWEVSRFLRASDRNLIELNPVARAPSLPSP